MRRLAAAAILVLLIPAHAAAQAGAGGAADSALAGPGPAALDGLSARIARARVRVSTDRECYAFRRARLEAQGVAFRNRDWTDYPIAPDGTWRRLPPSPIPWSAIRRVERGHSYAAAGVLLGGLAGGAVLARVMSRADEWTDFTGGVATVGVFIVMPALAGGLAGAAVKRWTPLWERDAPPAGAR